MRNLIQNFFHGLFKYDDAYRFIVKHRLWEGFGRYKFVPIAMLIGAIWFGLKILSSFWDKVSIIREEGIVQGAISVMSTSGDIIGEGFDFVAHGAYKYIILLLLEVLIFHFAVRTIEILSEQDIKVKFSTFVKAQIRMLKVIILNFGVEILCSLVIGMMLGIFGFGWLKVFFMFFVRCFLLGFIVMDNYNEILGMGMVKSFKHTTKYIGATLGIGLPLYVIMMIPIIGTILGPLLAVVAASLMMHEIAPNEIDEHEFVPDRALFAETP